MVSPHAMIDELHAHGVTSRSNELRRFNISAATAMASKQAGLLHFESTTGLVQVVTGRFVSQISSQNGQQSTYALAMVITQGNEQKPEQLVSQNHSQFRAS